MTAIIYFDGISYYLLDHTEAIKSVWCKERNIRSNIFKLQLKIYY